MSTNTQLQKEVELLRAENLQLKNIMHNNFFVSLEMFTMARQNILDDLEYFKNYPTENLLGYFKISLENYTILNNELSDDINNLRNKIIDVLNEVIAECNKILNNE